MRINIKKTTLILFCLISFFSEAHELDSLLNRIPHTKNEKSKVELWEKIINISIWQTSDSVRKSYIDSLFNYSKTKNYDYGIATANLLYSKHFERKQNLDKAREHASKAYESFKKQKNKLGLCKVLRQQGYNSYKASNLEKATEQAYKALEISISIKDRLQEALCLSQTAVFMFDTQTEESLEKQLKALNILLEIDAKREASIAAMALSTLNLNLGNNVESVKYLELFFKLQQRLNDIGLLAEGYANAAVAYNSIGKFDEAEQFIEKSGKYYLQIDSPVLQAKYYRMRGVFYRESGKHHEAIEAAQKALSLVSDKEGLDIEKGKLQYTLFFSYKALKRYEEAIEAYEETMNHEFNLYDQQTRHSISELKEKYESEKKEQENKNLKQINEINQLEISQKEDKMKEQKYIVLLLSLLLISLVIGFLFYRKSHALRKEKVKRKLEQQVFRTQMNPHFIFNSLNSIQRMYVEGNTDEANDFLTEFSGLIRNILENSNHDKITLNEEINTLKSYLELEKLRTKDKFDFTIDIDDSIDQYSYQVPPLVIQPFVENAIWHGILPGDRKGEIQVKLTKANDRIHVEVVDNGVGFSTENTEKHESHGIKITEKRIGSKVNIESSTEGTKIDFTI